MTTVPRHRASSRKGVIHFLSLLLMLVMSMLATTLSYQTILGARQGANETQAFDARLAAESGMSYAMWALKDCRSAPTFSDLPDMLTVVHDHLQATLPAGSVTLVNDDPPYIAVAPIEISDRQSFSFAVNIVSVDIDDPSIPTELELVVEGRSGGITRHVAMEFGVEVNKEILKYALASKLRLVVRGGVTINGDICAAWSRRHGTGKADGSGVAFPLDLGNSDANFRLQDNIIITGKIKTTLTQAEFSEAIVDRYGFDTTLDCTDGIRHPAMLDKLEFSEPDLVNAITHEDFDTSQWRDRQEAPAGQTPTKDQKHTLVYPRDNAPQLDTDLSKYRYRSGWTYIYRRGYKDDQGNFVIADNDPEGNLNPKFSRSGSYVKLGSDYVTTPVPNPTAPKVVYEEYANNVRYWRAYYANKNDDNGDAFTNLHVPQGTHAHFKNCTFKGITYIETDEGTDLSDTNASNRYPKYNNLRNGLSGEGGTATNTNSTNNITFENCTFEGPIVTGVPKDFRWDQNALQFIGNTKFKSSAIKQELAGTTIMAPNFNVDIGDFKHDDIGSESEIVGILVGGVVDIRDNAVVNGTVLSMAKLDHVSTTSVWQWDTNLGNSEYKTEDTGGNGFTPSQNIVLTPDPDNVLPLGFRRSYIIAPISGTYREKKNGSS